MINVTFNTAIRQQMDASIFVFLIGIAYANCSLYILLVLQFIYGASTPDRMDVSRVWLLLII